MSETLKTGREKSVENPKANHLDALIKEADRFDSDKAKTLVEQAKSNWERPSPALARPEVFSKNNEPEPEPKEDVEVFQNQITELEQMNKSLNEKIDELENKISNLEQANFALKEYQENKIKEEKQKIINEYTEVLTEEEIDVGRRGLGLRKGIGHRLGVLPVSIGAGGLGNSIAGGQGDADSDQNGNHQNHRQYLFHG